MIGFPHGGTSTAAKVAETETACRAGAREVDMVVNLGKVLSGDWAFVDRDIRSVVEAAHAPWVITKVIFETGLLPDDATKIRLCEISESAGAAGAFGALGVPKPLPASSLAAAEKLPL